MEYLSAKEASAKWGVHIRTVQECCKSGRIPGARKYGVSWMLPANAEKPADLRRERTAKMDKPSYTLLTTTPLPKGNPDRAVAALPEQYRALAAADLAYRRGDPEPAKEYWQHTDRWDATKLSAASLATAAAISAGDYALYYEIERFLKDCAADTESQEERALLSLPGTLAAVGMAAPDMTPAWLKHCDFALFPQELTPFLLYLYMLHLRNVGDLRGLLFTARTAISLCAQTNTFTWLDIYFLLLGAGASFGLGDEAQAEKYLSDALTLGMPCGLAMPFSDGLGEFGGLLERMIGQRYPEQLASVTRLWGSSFKNWMAFHNAFTKENITTILTTQEYQAAHLLVHGATYAETAKRMNLSVGRVKNILLDVYGKLYIQKKNQLREFVL